ncbi:MAG: hypothetical protein AAFQ04_01700 [Pseudomonadota bacterium]
MTKPNNFPREGEHQSVTRDAVDKFQNERPVFNREVHYTIGGNIEAEVHSSLIAEREAAITNGSRRLNLASEDLRKGMRAVKPDERTRYIQAQRKAAGQVITKNRSR